MFQKNIRLSRIVQSKKFAKDKPGSKKSKDTAANSRNDKDSEKQKSDWQSEGGQN